MAEDDFDPNNFNAGVIIYAKGNYVRLKIVKLDSEGKTVEILQGIALPPAVARSCAQKLTFASWKIEDGNDDDTGS